MNHFTIFHSGRDRKHPGASVVAAPDVAISDVISGAISVVTQTAGSGVRPAGPYDSSGERFEGRRKPCTDRTPQGLDARHKVRRQIVACATASLAARLSTISSPLPPSRGVDRVGLGARHPCGKIVPELTRPSCFRFRRQATTTVIGRRVCSRRSGSPSRAGVNTHSEAGVGAPAPSL
jgi:hypothetical protein